MNEIVEKSHNRFLIPRSGMSVGLVMTPPALKGDKANGQETGLVRFNEASNIEVYEVARAHLQHTNIVRRTHVNFINLQSPAGTAQPVIDRYRAVMDVSKRVLPGKIIDLVL